MDNKNTFKDFWEIIYKQFLYSLKIIFANKFIYFLGTSVLLFLLVVTINLFSDDNATIHNAFNLLLFPGVLLVFYPTTFGIQNDEDQRMLENIFSIPNYRYKVWIPRLVITFILVYCLLLILAAFSWFALVSINIFDMVYNLMYPVFFLGCLSFAVSTIVRSGNGTAVVMVVTGLIFWISAGILDDSPWNIFLNPYDLPNNVSEEIWVEVVSDNHLYLFIGTLLSILFGMFKLQDREKFI